MAIKYKHRRTSGEVWRCKKGHRSEIKPDQWDRAGYAGNDEVINRPIVYDQQTVPLPRLKRSEITPEQFYEDYVAKDRPCLIEGCMDHWPAMHKWAPSVLAKNHRHSTFKVGKDDKGRKLRMKFKYFADYMERQQDDSPLYLFETNIDDNTDFADLKKDFEVPDIFPHDWFNFVNQGMKPPSRWFCIGPKRSGTTVHTDPLSTCAWNAVSHGRKHWVLFEPKEKSRVVKGKDVRKKGEDDEAIMYFDFLLPRIKKEHPDLKVYECIQYPGDIIFVPDMWWHGVLNMDDCVAVTQNFSGPHHFDRVWRDVRRSREKVANLLLRNWRKFAPELAERAIALNKKDSFRMRHERGPGEKLPGGDSSSSSESSSDSSSDSEGDLDRFGLQAAWNPRSKRSGLDGKDAAEQGSPKKPRQRARSASRGAEDNEDTTTPSEKSREEKSDKRDDDSDSE